MVRAQLAPKTLFVHAVIVARSHNIQTETSLLERCPDEENETSAQEEADGQQRG